MTAARLDADRVRAAVEALPDPELPVITLGELGVIGAVRTAADGVAEVEFTPTFLGCPALPAITAAIADVLRACGHPDGRVRQVLAPPWSPERITPSGRAALAAHGIAPPAGAGAPQPIHLGAGAPCPHCGSPDTRLHSAFGPTRCQSLLRCTGCQEIFPCITAM